MKKIKTFVLTVSEYFPASHPRKGEKTLFVEKIQERQKIHTIRHNFPLWQKRIKMIQNNEAVLSVRVWTGKPYQSKQKEVAVLDYASGIGIELIGYLDIKVDKNFQVFQNLCLKEIPSGIPLKKLADNDGLSVEDFRYWFKDIGTFPRDLGIIHFTNFRYGN